MSQRWPIQTEGDPSILNKEFQFFTSKKIAKNKIYKCPLTERLSSYDEKDIQKSGIPTQKLINIYSKWGVGGFGLIFTGCIYVDPKHKELNENSVIHRSFDSLERKEAFEKCTQVLKKEGALAIAQLNHAGRMTPLNVNESPFSPSGVKTDKQKYRSFLTYRTPHEIPLDLVKKDVVDNFVFAAKYCYEAGFDGVELHAAYGYLLSEFLTLSTNKRTDEYGGSIENRARIIKEIYEGIRKEVSPETGFMVGVKINTYDFQDFDLYDNDIIKFCQEFDKYNFDFIEITGGAVEMWNLDYSKMKDTTKNREEFFQEHVKKIKPIVKNATIFLAGSLRTVYGMTRVINENMADAVGIGRPSMGEPDIAKKILSGEFQSVAYNQFYENDKYYSGSCRIQLNDAASTTLAEVHDHIGHGITDFSNPQIAKKMLEKYKSAKGNGQTFNGIL